ncbi:MAG: hypothetical protein ABW061_27150 [Polyangiaceae bacterium]
MRTSACLLPGLFGLSLSLALALSASMAGASEPDAPADPETTQGFTSRSGRPPLELTAGLRAVHRSFSYHDTPAELFPARQFPAPRTYELPLGPALVVGGSVFPGAWLTRGPGSWFGLTGGYELNFATQSVFGLSPNEQTLTTRAHEWFFGGKVRIPVAAHDFGLSGGVGSQAFNLLGDEAVPQVPDVEYQFYFLRAEGRLRFNALSLDFHVGTRFVHDTGGLERDFFPGRVKTQNIEAGLSAGFPLATHLELVAGLDWVRYAFDFNPSPPSADPSTKVIAGGAVDQYTSGWLGLRFSLPHY